MCHHRVGDCIVIVIIIKRITFQRYGIIYNVPNSPELGSDDSLGSRGKRVRGTNHPSRAHRTGTCDPRL